MTNAIEAHGLCKSYGDFSLKNVDLVLPNGTIMGLIGENGAGKTTTIKCILNLIRRDSGSISLLGQDNIAQEALAKQDVGVVLDECFFHDGLCPRHIDRMLSRIYNSWDSHLYQSYLKKFQLPETKCVKEFSRGMKMKLSLAAALAHRPKLLILDEATSGLDPIVRNEILDEFLGFIQDEDHSVLISSHITSDLEKVADYITYLHQGQVVISDAKDSVLEQYGRLACSAAQLSSIDPTDLIKVRRSSYGCEALVRDRASFQRKYRGLLVEQTTLEEIMIFMEKGEQP